MPSPAESPLLADLARHRRWLCLALLLMVAAGLRHNLVWGRHPEQPWLLPLLNALEACCLIAFAAIGGLAWWRAWRRCAQGGAASLGQLVRISLPILLLAVCVPLFLTTDPIDYVVRGRVMAVHGGNPYHDVALDYPDDPFLAFGDRGWKDMPLPYGPLVANLQGAIAWLAHLLPVSPRIELIVGLGLFKLVFAGAMLWIGALVWRIAATLRPGSEPAAFVAVTWNPLLLDSCVANAHNDGLVLVCLALAVVAAIGSRYAIATVALTAGALAKVVPALLGPVWFAGALRTRRLGSLAVGVVLSLLAVAAFALQFFAGEQGISEVMARQDDLEGASLLWSVQRWTGLPKDQLVRIGRLGVIAWVGWCSVRMWRRPEPRELVFATASSLFALALFGSALFGSWYHVWWLPFGLLLERGFLRRFAIAATFTAPLCYLAWAGLRRFDEPAQWWIATCGVWVPLALALLARPRRR
ncbi:MAG: hypothetical protein ACE37K_12915 [Planctomycetota bacterium]